MSIPYVKGFDYDLSRSEDGRCWARIRATGECVEISEEVMRELRREEKKEYRFQMTLDQRKEESKKAETGFVSTNAETGEDIDTVYCIQHPLPLEGSDSEDKCNSWEESPINIEGDVIGLSLTEQLVSLLTPKQKDCFVCCVILGESRSDYAKRTGISVQRVSEIFDQIRQKLKKLL